MGANMVESHSRQHAEDAAISVYRAAHLMPHLDFLRQIGAPVQSLLRGAKLPTMVGEDPEMLLPQFPTLRFLHEAAISQGIEDLSLLVLGKASIITLAPEFVVTAAGSATLNVALSHFQTLVSQEANLMRAWIDRWDAHAVFNLRYGLPLNAIDRRFEDWSQIRVMIAIIRAFAGSEWQPAQLSLCSPLPIERRAQEEFSNTRILASQSACSILIPNEVLSLPPQYCNFSGHHAEDAGGAVLASALREAGLEESLKAVLASYLGDGKPPIELAAEMSNTSVRTLQRRLYKTGKTYTDLVNETQFARAARLLRETDAKVIDIAFECGYDDASHFARAFRRIGGVSPRSYRRQCQTGAPAAAVAH